MKFIGRLIGGATLFAAGVIAIMFSLSAGIMLFDAVARWVVSH